MMDERRCAISDSIVIGYTPENEARRIVIDVRKHAALWPDAEVQLWVQRRGDAAPYVAQAAYADGEILWVVTDYDTAMPGCGEAWAAFFGRGESKLLALAGPSVVTVLPGPRGFATGTPPETTPPWAVEVIEAARRIEEGGGITPEQIAEAIEAYLSEHPIEVTVDATLSKAGAAADAKATGDALAGKLDADKLREATDAALAQARDSGEFNGKDGAPGEKGDKGEKGDTGETGADGKDGKDGEPGYTPVKGTDYWTAADRQQMVSDVLTALPTWTGGEY